MEGLEHFWTPDRILFVALFVAGLLIGGYVTHSYVEPYLGATAAQDQNYLVAENARLDLRADSLYKCLVQNNIPPGTCNLEIE